MDGQRRQARVERLTRYCGRLQKLIGDKPVHPSLRRWQNRLSECVTSRGSLRDNGTETPQ